MFQAANVLPLTGAVLHMAGATLDDDTPSTAANGTASGAAADTSQRNLWAFRSGTVPVQPPRRDAPMAAGETPTLPGARGYPTSALLVSTCCGLIVNIGPGAGFRTGFLFAIGGQACRCG